MANTNIINAVFGSGICAVTTSAFRANYGMVLRFSGIDLPTAFEVDFSNYDVMGRDSITMIGQNGEVQIPDDLWDSGLNIYAYVYLHPTDNSGVTVYTVTIPVLGRPNRTEETPTPHEQSVIEQAISALNDAVEQTAADVVAADASASAAAQSEANAATSERSAAASAGAALASQNAAESASQSAMESASGAAESARNAANSASQAAQSATNAQASAEQAERSAQSIEGDVERAERAAQTATEKATEAVSSAATASSKANEAAQSASSAASAAQNAASSAQSAESSATDAEQAKQDAQDAQAAAEQAAESVSGLSEQIVQNTSDIAELVQSKAGVLVDTATGSIASFVPDSTVPTVRGLTVDVEPVQDLHGYDAPWPAGGGKNKLQNTATTSTIQGVTFTVNNDGTVVANGTSTGWNGLLINTVALDAGTYILSSGVVSGYANLYLETSGAATVNTNKADGAVTFTLGEPGQLTIKLYARPNNSLSNVKVYPMIRLASVTDATYAPYSNICPISGWDAVEVQRTGKNLWSFNSSYSPTGYQVILNRVPFDLKAGTYTFSAVPNIEGDSIVLFGYHADGTRMEIARLLANTARRSVVSTISKNVVSLFFVSNKAGTISNIQLELGSTATAYKTYQGDTYTIPLGQTVYGGTVDAVQGVLTVDRALVDLGTLTWNKINTTGSHWRFWAYLNDMAYDGEMLSSQYKHITASQSYLGEIGIASQASGSSYLAMVTDERFSDAATFKSAMSGVQLVYELATPITISLTPIEVAVLTGQTNNIWADSGNVSVEYAADLKTYIDNKIAAAVAALS